MVFAVCGSSLVFVVCWLLVGACRFVVCLFFVCLFVFAFFFVAVMWFFWFVDSRLLFIVSCWSLVVC